MCSHCMCRGDACGIRATVGVDVLHRFVGAVLMERAVVVVVMRLFLQMQHDVLDAVAMSLHETRRCDGEPVPQQRHDEQKNGGRFTHRANLAESRGRVEPGPISRAASSWRRSTGKHRLRSQETRRGPSFRNRFRRLAAHTSSWAVRRLELALPSSRAYRPSPHALAYRRMWRPRARSPAHLRDAAAVCPRKHSGILLQPSLKRVESRSASASHSSATRALSCNYALCQARPPLDTGRAHQRSARK